MAQLGGQDLSGIGFGLGVDRTVLALEAEGVSPTTGRRVDVYGVPMGADAKRRMAVVVDRLRRAGVSADMSYGDRGLKGAMKGADRAGALLALVIGGNELETGTVVVRDLATRQQEEVALEDVELVVRKALGES